MLICWSRYMNGLVSEAVDVRQHVDVIPPAFTICPTLKDSYKQDGLKVIPGS